jgi:transposase-like protein
MRRVRHTREQRAEILEQVRSGERSVGEIAQEEGISVKTIHNWMRAKKVNIGGFIEVPTTPPRATVVELSFADGTVLRIRG